MQKILSFFIFIFLVYSIFKSRVVDFSGVKETLNSFSDLSKDIKNDNSNGDKEKKSQELQGNFIEKSVSTIAANLLKTDQGKEFFNKLIQPKYNVEGGQGLLVKSNNQDVIRSFFMINDIAAGSGEPACCGQRVKVLYKTYDINGTSKDSEEDFILGFSRSSPTLDSIIVGMQKGGSRSAVIKDPKYLMKDLSNAPQGFQTHISLLETYPIKFEKSKIHIFDTTSGYSMPVLCGDTIDMKIKIADLGGKEFYTSQKISFTLGGGSEEWPDFFSYILFNKITYGSRFVIAPAIYLEKLTNRLGLNIHGEKYLIIEFYDIENKSLIKQP